MSEIDDLRKRTQELEVENHHLKTAFSDLEKAYALTLHSLSDAVDFKAGTGGHSKRVAAYSIVLARAMGIPQEQIEMIAHGASLHDIGKMTIPNCVLEKPGKLVDAEWAIMREHCFKGYQMVHEVPFLAEAAEIVYSHHERYDGTGYPRGLKADQISLGARIVAVTEALDSITSRQSYRFERSLQVARREIEDWAGRQFDPEVVRVFQQTTDETFEELRRTIKCQY